MPVETFAIGPLQTNSYIIYDAKDAVSIDVGGEPALILEYLKKRNLKLCAICLTHMHFDHIYGVADLAEKTGAPVYEPEKEKPILDSEAAKGGIWGMPPVKPFKSSYLQLGENSFGDLKCIVMETPGHTPGGVSIYFPAQKCVFTGDALFYQSIGRTDFYMGNHGQLLKSIHEKLFTLHPETIVYPGHGPQTTIKDEKENNPFLNDFSL